MAAKLTLQKITIEYGAVANLNSWVCGWVPVIYVNGRMRGDTYCARGYEKWDAEERAAKMAEEEAKRFGGDWEIEILAR